MNKKALRASFAARGAAVLSSVLEACAHGPLWNGWNMEGFTGLFHTAFTKSTEWRVVESGTSTRVPLAGMDPGWDQAWLWHCHSGSSHGTAQRSLCTHRQSLRQIFRCHCRQKPQAALRSLFWLRILGRRVQPICLAMWRQRQASRMETLTWSHRAGVSRRGGPVGDYLKGHSFQYNKRLSNLQEIYCSYGSIKTPFIFTWTPFKMFFDSNSYQWRSQCC